MSFRDGPFQDLKVPLALAGAAAAVIALILAVFLFIQDQKASSHAVITSAVRTKFDQTLEPISAGAAAPIRWMSEAAGYLVSYIGAVEENQRLKHEVAQVQKLRDQVTALQNLNRRYESMLGLRTEPALPTVAARVVSDVHGPYSQARLLDVGSEKGVVIGNPVISEHGVIGRIVGAARGVSRVLLLTDPESRTPVLVNATNARAILTGDGGGDPRLLYLRGRNPVKEGDVILTSGDGGLYPRGLPVGVAVKDLLGLWRVRLYSDQAPLDFVEVVRFEDFSQLGTSQALEAHQLPPLSPSEQAQMKATLSARSAAPSASLPKPTPTLAKPSAKPSATPATKGPAVPPPPSPVPSLTPAPAPTP